ncbi:MAG: HAD family hydrolase [Terriglobia bacterium]
MSQSVQPSNSCFSAAIFDMDGVLVDSNPFHVEKWKALLRARNIPFSPDELPRQILGQRNDNAFRLFFGSGLGAEEIRRLGAELEAEFREAFRPHARPLPGLEKLLNQLRSENIPMAVASSAIGENVEFVVSALGLREFFRVIVNGDQVCRPKPDPEIYLKVAGLLGVAPEGCVAFEDSFVGIEAVKGAGMKCIAIASTFPRAELIETRADGVVADFSELSPGELRTLFGENGARERGGRRPNGS